MADAPLKNIAKPTFEFLRDTIKGNQHIYRIKITSNRSVNRYDIFNNDGVQINNFIANNVKSIDFKSNISSKTKGKLLSYYVVDNQPLVMDFSIPVNQKLDLNLVESSFDLMSNPLFTMTKRKAWMMPTPFVLNDAVIIRQKVKASPKIVEAKPTFRRFSSKDTLKVAIDRLQQ
jgi:hypothetical protein